MTAITFAVSFLMLLPQAMPRLAEMEVLACPVEKEKTRISKDMEMIGAQFILTSSKTGFNAQIQELDDLKDEIKKIPSSEVREALSEELEDLRESI